MKKDLNLNFVLKHIGCLRNKYDDSYSQYIELVAKIFGRMVERYSGYFKEIFFCCPESKRKELQIFEEIFGKKEKKKIFQYSRDKTITVLKKIPKIHQPK